MQETDEQRKGRTFVVGIGASAGGLEAIEHFFDNIALGSGASYVVVQHLSPDFKSLMAQLLERHTSLSIHVAEDGMDVLPDRIYVIPPRAEMTIRNGHLSLAEQREARTPPLVIDTFFRSLAEDAGAYSIGIVLSGTGSDGARGLCAIQQAGGLTLAQDVGSAKFDGMPRAAAATGAVDAVLPPWEMGPRVRTYVLEAEHDSTGSPPEEPRSPSEPVKAILDLVGHEKDVDFSQYKSGTVLRRMKRRMSIARVEDAHEYHDLLLRSPAELDQLFRDLLINVSEFFRDPVAFDVLARALPKVASLAEDGHFRAWVPGCATGEEAYSLAMLMHEIALAPDLLQSCKIFATDISTGSLTTAGEGRYPFGIADSVEPRFLNEFFDRTSDGYQVSRPLREHVVFAQHDLTRDPPFTRLHLVSCRNLLIYLTPEMQERVLHLLHSALVPGGCLFLGPSEVLGKLSPEFEEVDPKWRIYRKLRDVRLRTPGTREPRAPKSGALAATPKRHLTGMPVDLDRVCAAFLSEFTPTCLVLDQEGNVLHTFGNATAFLRIPSGQATLDVHRMLPSPARSALSAAMHGARTRGQDVEYRGIAFADDPAEDGVVLADMTVKYLSPRGHHGQQPLYLVLLSDPLERARHPDDTPHDLEAESVDRMQFLERELQHTKESLRATIEELETTNEELQSTNEELLASNEELQGTNEELHSVNEELYTVSAEHQGKIEELTQLSDDMENLLRSTDVGTVFLDEKLRIRNFTPQVSEIIALLPTDIGRPIHDLAHGLHRVDLGQLASRVVENGRPIEQETADAHGTPRLLRVLPYSTSGQVSGTVITLIDITRIKDAQRSLAESEERFQELVERLDQVFWTTSPDGLKVDYVSPLGEEFFGVPLDEMSEETSCWFDHVLVDERERVRDEFQRGVADGDLDMELAVQAPGKKLRWIHAKGFPITDEKGRTVRVVGFARDITTDKSQQMALESLASELESKAHTDLLTDLKNRRGLEVELTRELSRARRSGHRVTAVLIDLDDFKEVNDSLGHATGDVVLSGAAERMVDVLRPSDSLARLGGDEFLALLPETRLPEAVRVAERLRLAVADDTISISDRPLRVTASLGVAVVPAEAVSIEEVLDGTRQALSAGKQGGKDRVIAATDGSGNLLAHFEVTDPEIHTLTTNGAIHALCQPIRDLVSGRVAGYEMLSRGPEGPYAMPSEFLRLSLEKNMLNLVDLQCLRACVMGSTVLNGNGAVHVNLYPSTLVDTPVERIIGLLQDAGGPRRFCIELSEQLFLGAPQYLIDAVRDLREQGVRVALDDVGFGRSSIEALVLLEPDVIKLAREFIRDCDRDRCRREGLERLVRASQALSSALVAEGVEREGERDVLIELGVPFAQGFLWDHPIEPAQAATPATI